MSAFDNARMFFETCDAAKSWDECKVYVADGASFEAQSEPLTDISTVQAYCDWMHGFGTITVPGCSYTLHTSAYDEDTKTAMFFATFHGTHSGDGGPVPPTNKQTNTHYVYFLTMNDDDKVEKMVKVWNAPWAMRELGWMQRAPQPVVDIEARLAELGIELPAPPAAIGNFVPGVIFDSILYVSGTYGTVKDESGNDVIPQPGKVGGLLSVEDGYESAKLMLINHLAMAKAVLRDLDLIDRPIRLVGYVNAAIGFQDAPSVLNGASDLLFEIFGKKNGSHARMALYQHELARNAPVAGEIMFGLKR